MRRGSPFTLYWASAAASYLGDGVRFSALPMLAASLSSSPGDVALVSAALSSPWLVFGLVAGVIVDRMQRAPLMAALQVTRALVGVAIVVAVAADVLTIPLLAGLVLLLGTAEVLFDVASHAVLPTIVDRARLQWANGRLVTVEVVAFEFVGPALGGVLFAAATTLPFAFDALSFGVSAALLWLVVRGRAPTVADSTATEPQSILTDLVAGLRWFRGHGLVRSLSLQSAAINLGAGGFYAVLVLFAERELALGPIGYGALIAISAVGSVVAGVVAHRLTSGTARRLVGLVTAPTVVACFAVIAAVPQRMVTAAAMVTFGFAVSLYNVVAVSLRQLVTPDDMLGRVTSVHRFLCWGALPVGAVLAGAAGSRFGIRAAITACAVAVAVVGLGALRPVLQTPASAYAPELLERVSS